MISVDACVCYPIPFGKLLNEMLKLRYRTVEGD